MTVLEAHVDEDRVQDLEAAYREGIQQLPPGLTETFLVRDTDDRTVFRIVTIWASREALDQMRASVETPGGVLMFQAAGASPELSILDVIVHGRSD